MCIRDRGVFGGYLTAGLSLFHLDMDARVCGNLMTLIEPETNMAFSQGIILPQEVSIQEGAVVCCGAFFARGSIESGRFFAQAVINCEKRKNDQVAVNETFFKKQLHILPEKHKRKHRYCFNDIVYSWDDKPLSIVAHNGDKHATIWSMETVSRLPSLPSRKLVIWHPHLSNIKSSYAWRLNVIFYFPIFKIWKMIRERSKHHIKTS